MRAFLKPIVAILAFFDGIIESVVRPEQLRRRVENRTTLTGGSSPDPNRRPPRR